MCSVITVRNIDPGDKSWLQNEARHRGISMEGFVRQLIHEKRAKCEGRRKPSEVFRSYFGPEHGVDLQLTERYSYRPVTFSQENGP